MVSVLKVRVFLLIIMKWDTGHPWRRHFAGRWKYSLSLLSWRTIGSICLLKVRLLLWNLTHVCHWNDTTSICLMQRMSLDHSPRCLIPLQGGYLKALLGEKRMYFIPSVDSCRTLRHYHIWKMPSKYHWPNVETTHQMLISPGEYSLSDFPEIWLMVYKTLQVHVASGGREGSGLRFLPLRQ